MKKRVANVYTNKKIRFNFQFHIYSQYMFDLRISHNYNVFCINTKKSSLFSIQNGNTDTESLTAAFVLLILIRSIHLK